MVDLAYKEQGQGQPFIVLHGLYGMSDNWMPLAKRFESRNKVYLLDIRNHGKSPHTQTHTYADISTDTNLFFQKHSIDKAIILGHSMGGKAAMRFALENPEKVQALIIVDIAPIDYAATEKTIEHKKLIEAMMQLPVEGFDSRTDIERELDKKVHDMRTTRFLLKNLEKLNKGYTWKLNLDVLQKSLDDIAGDPNTEKMAPAEIFPSLLLKGSESDYVTERGEKEFRYLFPRSKVITIDKAGHWLHSEQPDKFFATLEEFLN